MPAAGDAHDRRPGKRDAGRRASLHQRPLAHARTGNAERLLADAGGQDLVDAPAGRVDRRHGARRGERQGLTGNRRPQAFGGDGLPAVRQLSSFTVFENIASPLRVQGRPNEEVERRVGEVASLLRLEPYLDRLPLALSGASSSVRHRPPCQGRRPGAARRAAGQSRLQAARELRAELPPSSRCRAHLRLRHHEPSKRAAGGRTICLSEGRALQVGGTSAVYRRPDSLRVAELFSDPPLNTVASRRRTAPSSMVARHAPANGLYAAGRRAIQRGLRAHQLAVANGGAGHHIFPTTVALTEITGSESFVTSSATA